MELISIINAFASTLWNPPTSIAVVEDMLSLLSFRIFSSNITQGVEEVQNSTYQLLTLDRANSSQLTCKFTNVLLSVDSNNPISKVMALNSK